MVKNKNNSHSYDKTTTMFGYGLFAITVLAFLLSTALPFSFSFQYPTARYFNIIVMVVSFAIAALLPALAAYFIGDRATHAKNKSLHHYNGVLFGFASYWVSLLFGWVGFSSLLGVKDDSFPLSLVVNSVVPVIVTILIMVFVAVSYAKNKKVTTSVLEHRPFQLVLLAAALGTFILPYFMDSSQPSYDLVGLLLYFLPVVAICVAYGVLAKFHTTRLTLLTDALIATSIAWISIWLAHSFIYVIQVPYQVISPVAYVAGLAVFAVYLYLRSRNK